MIYGRYVKRLLDIVLSLCGIMLLSPVFLALAVLVRVKLGSPVLFQQERPGKGERIFTLWKFRTMTDKRGADGKLLADSERLTRFGRTLRALSLDELPELFNILKGDMSIIGPRPLLVSYLPWYTEEERLRHTVRPGLTGLAQVSGRNYIDWDSRFQKDVEYVRNLSFAMDAKVLWLTVKTVLSHGDGVAEDTNRVEGNFAEIRKRKREEAGVNILILSAGTRNKVVQYFKRELGDAGKVIATDCSNLAPAVYEADRFYLVPRITEPGYLARILEICREEKVKGVFSLIDPELSLLAKERERFLAVGATPVVPPYELVETCFDKYKMYELLLKMGIPTGKCFVDRALFYEAVEKGEMTYPVFVKPVTGSASININKVFCREEIDVLFDRQDGMMIQEYMDGVEYGADVYIDMISGKCTSIFVKEKIKMRAGETDKSVSVKDEALFALIRNFVETCGFCGMIDMDIFRIGGTYYISEVNPRFGGGYPHAYECGVNLPSQVIRNLKGESNPDTIGDYREGICMMKYNEVAIRDMSDTEIVR